MNVLDEHIPVGWDFPDRTTYRDMVHLIINDSEMHMTKDVPINPKRSFCKPKEKIRYGVRYCNVVTRDVPMGVWKYYLAQTGESSEAV